MENARALLAFELAKRLKNDDIIGVGTGTTVSTVINSIGDRIKKEKLRISAVTTSYETAMACVAAGILPIEGVSFSGTLSWGFDGADEIDDNLWAIKGKGGALLREKIMAKLCAHYILIGDESKKVLKLGEKTKVPVEVLPMAKGLVERELSKMGFSEIFLREGAPGKHGPVLTESGNLIFDIKCLNIHKDLDKEIKCIPGVVDTGLFLELANEVLISDGKNVRQILKKG